MWQGMIGLAVGVAFGALGVHFLSAHSSVADSESAHLREFALSVCLRRAMPDETFWRKEGSAGAYMEKGDFDVAAVETVEAMIATKIAETYPSKHGMNLAIMKCLDFYNSAALRELAAAQAR